MLGHISVAAIVFVGAGLAVAQSLPVSLTSSCSTTLQGLLTSPDAECLNLPSLLTYVINPNKSIPQTANIWLTGLCGNGACSNENIANIVADVAKGCSEDFSNIGVDIASLQGQITNIAQQAYPTIRKVACLKDTTANELCVTQTLNNLEKTIGKVDLTSLNIDTLNQDAQILLSSNITELACTSCIKAAYNTGMNDFPAQVSQANVPLQLVCGAPFLDRAAPADVVTTADQGFSVNLAKASSGVGMKSFIQRAGWGSLIALTFIFLV